MSQENSAGNILHDFLNNLSRGCRREVYGPGSPDRNNPPQKDYLLAEEYDNMTDEQEKAYYMQVVPNSHFFTTLEMILRNVEMLNIGYQEREKPDYGEFVYVEWPPVSIEHIITGIKNIISNGYKLTRDGK